MPKKDKRRKVTTGKKLLYSGRKIGDYGNVLKNDGPCRDTRGGLWRVMVCLWRILIWEGLITTRHKERRGRRVVCARGKVCVCKLVCEGGTKGRVKERGITDEWDKNKSNMKLIIEAAHAIQDVPWKYVEKRIKVMQYGDYMSEGVSESFNE